MKRKNTLFVLLAIIVVLVVVLVIINVSKNKENKKSTGDLSNESYLNSSEKLTETKIVGNYEVLGISLQSKDEGVSVNATLKNTSSNTLEETFLTLKILDESGNVIDTLNALVGKCEAGSTRGISVTSTVKQNEVYDIEFNIK